MFDALFVGVGIALVAVGCWKLRPAYHVYRGDTDDVVSIERADGPVELEGTASPIDRTISAPLTGTDCLAYEYEVEELQSSGKNSSWNTVDEGVGGVPFRLEDATASVRVEPAGADLALSTEASIEVDGGEPEPEPIKAFLETESDLESENTSLDLRVVEIATGNDRRYHERRLEPGEDAYVFGQSRYDVDARETMRDVSAVIEDGPDTPAFVVADATQDVAARRLAKPAAVWIALGILAAGIGLVSTM
ncbi:GIDE domain-containing protein [Natronolimnohabitans sp. A-GB9]|uniref:GIDE domain-containing protein n=1 Tax=Natronolimnohabitans sp. A-GB9 TaxID=3069757 RepID=UPI0027B1B117|nr:GIDE domain-containing protein [Natronolimnohabitans sp. A-GB9]MDQ2052553.1 GIDE domain-containing protein [Natronolimnohabitans sp. A-GB9]